MSEFIDVNHCDFIYNGQDALDTIVKIIEREVNRTLPHPNQLVEINPIKLILLDFMLPRLDGIQVITRLRNFVTSQNLKHKDVYLIKEPKIVMMTAYRT